MPIEIKELHIKVTVNADQQAQQGGARSTSSGQQGASGSPPDTGKIVDESVEQVLDILKKKKER